jgi:hypothetical protein
MAPTVVTSLLIGAWLIVVGLLYALFVPGALAPLNLMFIAAVLLLLVAVVALKWRGSAPVRSIGQVLYDAEHPASKR